MCLVIFFFLVLSGCGCDDDQKKNELQQRLDEAEKRADMYLARLEEARYTMVSVYSVNLEGMECVRIKPDVWPMTSIFSGRPDDQWPESRPGSFRGLETAPVYANYTAVGGVEMTAVLSGYFAQDQVGEDGYTVLWIPNSAITDRQPCRPDQWADPGWE